MASNRQLDFALRFRMLVEGLKNVVGLSNGVKGLRDEASKPIPDPTPELRAGADRTADAIASLSRRVVGLVGIREIQRFVDESVEQYGRAEKAYRGLEAVANYTGQGIGKALAAVRELTSDGLVNETEMSKAMQSLLQFGFTVEQATKFLKASKDTAAFNAAAHLSMGEAISSAAEGIRNENSVLVDNMGLAKNLSVIYKEYGETVGKTADDLTKSDKVQALLTIGLKEMEAQAGNAEKAASGYAAELKKADAVQKRFSESMGQVFLPMVVELRQAGIAVIERFLKPMVFLFQAGSVEMERAQSLIVEFLLALNKFDFSNLSKEFEKINQIAEGKLQKLAANLNGVSFEPIGDSAKKAAKDTDQATADMNKAAKQLAKERKEAVNDQIKDAERLRDALTKAFDDAVKTERDYLAQAKKLRAEASATPRDGSVEGQAAANLDLIAAEQALMRMRGSAGLEDLRAQVELVEALAVGIDDQARATEAMNRAKLAEADALERAAGEEAQRQAQITEQQKQNDARLVQFQALLKSLEAGKTVAINADTATATTEVEKFKYLIDSIKDKTVTLAVKSGSAAVPGYARGTVLPGYGGGDRRLALLEDGEAITRKEAVAYYGRNFLAAINNRQIPRFSEGGFVDRIAGSAPMSPSANNLQPVTLKIDRIGDFPMMGRPEVVQILREELGRAALQRGRRV